MKIDPFTMPAPGRRLRPDEIDAILDRLLMARAVDPAQVPMNQPPVADGSLEARLGKLAASELRALERGIEILERLPR